jgi:hypothetical protein
MIIGSSKKKKKIENKIFKLLNEIKYTKEDFDNIDNINVTDEDIKIIKSKVYKNIGMKTKNTAIKKLAIVASIAVLMTISIFNFNIVVASIKNMLQFIPGIGVVERTGTGVEHYMLTKMINKSYSDGKIIIRGFDINNKNATLVIDGNKIPYFNSVEIEDNNGKIYKMSEFSHGDFVDNSNKSLYWSKTYKYIGNIKAGKDCTIILNKKIKIPMSLVVDSDIKSLNELGPTQNIDGINLTAVSSIEDNNKLKIDLLSSQNNTKNLYYPNSHIPVTVENDLSKDIKNTLVKNSPIYLTDNTGSKYTAYMSPNISLGDHEYYFKTKNFNEQYVLTISTILIDYNLKTSVLFNLPVIGEGPQKKIVDIAGYPVGLSIMKINDTKVRIYVDINYNKNLKKNLVSFALSSSSIKNNNIFSKTLMKSHLFSSPDYFEFNVDKNTKQLKLELIHPLIEEQGPWNFNIKLKQ